MPRAEARGVERDAQPLLALLEGLLARASPRDGRARRIGGVAHAAPSGWCSTASMTRTGRSMSVTLPASLESLERVGVDGRFAAAAGQDDERDVRPGGCAAERLDQAQHGRSCVSTSPARKTSPEPSSILRHSSSNEPHSLREADPLSSRKRAVSAASLPVGARIRIRSSRLSAAQSFVIGLFVKRALRPVVSGARPSAPPGTPSAARRRGCRPK